MRKRKIVVFLMIIITILLNYSIFSIWYYCAVHNTYLKNATYDSVEELSDDLIVTIANNADVDVVYYPKELAFYIELDDKVFLFFKYANRKDEIQEDKLYIVVLKIIGGKYMLETPKNGFGKSGQLYLNQEKSIKMEGESSIRRIRIDGKLKSVCFFYKKYDETMSICYDGNYTTEIKMVNPFNGEQFKLCYAISFADPKIRLVNRHKVTINN